VFRWMPLEDKSYAAGCGSKHGLRQSGTEGGRAADGVRANQQVGRARVAHAPRRPQCAANAADDAPELYYVTDHYLGYDAVLVRLERLNRELLLDLLAMAHRFAMRKGKRRAYGANGGELLVRYRNIQARH